MSYFRACEKTRFLSPPKAGDLIAIERKANYRSDDGIIILFDYLIDNTVLFGLFRGHIKIAVNILDDFCL